MRRYQLIRTAASRGAAFSLVELVLVVTIIGLISAIAVPRMSSAVSSATANSLEATLGNVRGAIDMYYAEHGRYPGYDPVNATPDGPMFLRQLVEFSDERGRTSETFAPPYVFGPYLRRPFPKNPFNGLPTVHVKLNPGAPNPAEGSVGWVAVLSHGYFGVSATDSQFEAVGINILDAITQTTYKGLGILGI